MNLLAPQRLTVEEFIVWAQSQPDGRFELEDGQIIKMASETVGHVRVKHRVVKALEAAIVAAQADVFAQTDGTTVRINAKTAYGPDAMIYGGPELADDVIEIPNPIVVVEVLSKSSGPRDRTRKLKNYFKVKSIHHYLIVDPENRLVEHYWRATPSLVMNNNLGTGIIRLDPPGLVLQVEALLPTF